MAVINPITFTTDDGRSWAAHHTDRPFLAVPDGGGGREHFATLDAARRHAAAAGRGYRIFFDYAPGEGVLAERVPTSE